MIDLDTKTCAEVIRYWIKNNGVAMPNKKILQEIMKAFSTNATAVVTVTSSIVANGLFVHPFEVSLVKIFNEPFAYLHMDKNANGPS